MFRYEVSSDFWRAMCMLSMTIGMEVLISFCWEFYVACKNKASKLYPVAIMIFRFIPVAVMMVLIHWEWAEDIADGISAIITVIVMAGVYMGGMSFANSIRQTMKDVKEIKEERVTYAQRTVKVDDTPDIIEK